VSTHSRTANGAGATMTQQPPKMEAAAVVVTGHPVDHASTTTLKCQGVSKRLWREVTTDRVTKNRLTGDLDAITNHLSSFRVMQSMNGKLCKWCGIPAFTYCDQCPDKPTPHLYPTKGNVKGKACAIQYHNNQCYGLARCDAPAVGLQMRNWKEPSQRKMQYHSDAVDKNCREVAKEEK
jgi:hypothetical protein